MDLVYPLIGGIVGKVYDDIVDEGIPVNDTFKESLKGIQWMTLALASVGDFNYTLIQLTINIVNHLCNPDAFKFPYEYSLILLYPIFLFLSFHTMQTFQFMDILILILCSVSVYSERKLISEDVSYGKFVFRFISLLIFIGAYVFAEYLHLSSSMLKMTAFGIGYFVISSLFQFYMLTKSNSKEPQAPEPKEKESQALNPNNNLPPE